MPHPLVTGFEASDLFSDSDIARHLERVPEEHTAEVAAVRYVDEVQPYDPEDDSETPLLVSGELLLDPEGSGKAEIVIYRQQPDGNADMEEFVNTLYHELGHSVYQSVMSGGQRQQWNDLAMTAELWFNEAGENPLEHFAECYAKFVVHPRVCQAATPREFEFIRDELFDGMVRGDQP